MKSDPTVSCSDLEAARALSRRLAARSAGTGGAASPDAGYVRFAWPAATRGVEDSSPAPGPVEAVVASVPAPPPPAPRAEAPAEEPSAPAPSEAPAGPAAVPAAATPVQVPSARVAPAPAPPAIEEARTWDDFLALCLPVAGAEGALVMGDQGLLIASCGPIPASDLEGVGARLMATLDHGRRMQLEEGREPAVVVELGMGWLTGFTVVLRDGSKLTMGLIGPAALHAEARSLIASALILWRASVSASSRADLS